ncbi:MAG TPA: hypothetical protein VN767_19705 [Streptosporangiaceae bacterium]|nr:hypothetical protein [Streptosporangiaceae bacterium]
MAVTVPAEVNWLLDLLCGQDWPQGDEDKLRAASQAWMDAMVGIAALADHADLTSQQVSNANAYSTSGEAFTSFWNTYLQNDPKLQTADGGVFEGLYTQCEQQARALVDQANEVEYTKLIIVFTLILVAIQIAWAIAAAIMTMGGSLAEIGLAMFLGRESIMIALSRFLQMALTMLIPDLIAQTVMVVQGKGWDAGKTLSSGENALAGGLLGAFLGAGMSKLPWMGEDFAKTFGGKLVQGLSHFAEGGLVNDGTTLATVGTQYAWADSRGDKATMAQLSQELSAGNLFHQFLQGGALATAFYLPHLALPHGAPLTFTDADGNQYQVVLTDRTLARFTADDNNLSGQKLTVFNDKGYGVGQVTLDGNTATIDYTFGGSKTVDLSERGFTVGGHDGSLTTYGFDDQGQTQVVSSVRPSDGSVTIPAAGHDVTVPEGSMVHYAVLANGGDGTVFRADIVDGNKVTTWQTGTPGEPLAVTGVTVHDAVPIATGVFGVRSSTVYGAEGTSGDPVANTSWFSGHTSYGDTGVAGYHAAVGDRYSPFVPAARAEPSALAGGQLAASGARHADPTGTVTGDEGTRSQNQDQPQVTVPIPVVIDPNLLAGHEGDLLTGQPRPPVTSPEPESRAAPSWPELFDTRRGPLPVPEALRSDTDLVASRSDYDQARADADAAYRRDIRDLEERGTISGRLEDLDLARRQRTQAYGDQLKTLADAFKTQDRELLQQQRQDLENQIKPYTENIARLESELRRLRAAGADSQTITELVEQRRTLGQERNQLGDTLNRVDQELRNLDERYGRPLDRLKADLGVELTRRQHLDLDRLYEGEQAKAGTPREWADLDAKYRALHDAIDTEPGAGRAREWVLRELDRDRAVSQSDLPDLDARQQVVRQIAQRVRELRDRPGTETEIAELQRIGARIRSELAGGAAPVPEVSPPGLAGLPVDAAVAEMRARLQASGGRTVAAGYKLLVAGTDDQVHLVRGGSSEPGLDPRWVRTSSGGIVEYGQRYNEVPLDRLVGSFSDRSVDAESLLVQEVSAKLAALRAGGNEPVGVVVIGADKLMCPSCQSRMYDLMDAYPGVKVVLATGEETVIFDPDMAEIRPNSVYGPGYVAGAEVVPLGDAAVLPRGDGPPQPPAEVRPPDLSPAPGSAEIPPLDEPVLVETHGVDLSSALAPAQAPDAFSQLAGAMRLRAASSGRMQAIVLDDEGQPRWVEIGRDGMFYPTGEAGPSWQRVLVATESHPVDPADVALQFPPEQADGRIVIPPSGDAYRLVPSYPPEPRSGGSERPEPVPPGPPEPGLPAEPAAFGLGRGDESLVWAVAAGEPTLPPWYHGPRVEFYGDRSDGGNEIALYALYDRKTHEFLKIGISDDPLTIRYRGGIRHEDDREIDVFVIGKFGRTPLGDSRTLITAVERYLVERWTGPLSNEEWAGREAPTQPDPAWQAVRDLLDKPGTPGGWPATEAEDRQFVADLTAMVKTHIGPAFADRLNEIAADLAGPMSAGRRAALQADQHTLTAAAGAPLTDFFSDRPAGVNLYDHAFYDRPQVYRDRLNGQQVWAEPGREQLVGAYYRYTEQAKLLDQIADRFLSGDPVALAAAKAAIARIDAFSRDMLDAAKDKTPFPSGPQLHDRIVDIEKLKDDLLADARRPAGNRAQVDKIWKPAMQGDDALPWLQRSEPYELYLNWLRGRPGLEPVADLLSRLGAEQYGDWANAAKCVHAALAYEASRRAGELVTPTELPPGFVHGATSGRQLADLASVWGGDTRFTELGADQLVRARAVLREIFAGFGDGARGVVAIGYADGTGHVINVENVHGRIVFADALDGKLDASYRLKGMTVGSGRDRSVVAVDYVSFLRTDDRNPSPEAIAQFVHLPDGMSADRLMRTDLTGPASAGPFSYADPAMGRIMGEGGSNPPSPAGGFGGSSTRASTVVEVPHVTYAPEGVSAAGDVVLASAVANSRPWVLEVGAHSEDSWLGPVTPHSFDATPEAEPPPNVFAYGDPEVTRSLSMFPQTMDAVVVHDATEVFGPVAEFGPNLRPGGIVVLDAVPAAAARNVPDGYVVVHASPDGQVAGPWVRVVVQRAVGDVHADLDDAVGAGVPAVSRSAEEIARLVRLMQSDTSDPSLFPQPIEIENRWGITQENQRWFQYFVDKYGLAIDVRPSNPESVPLLELGGVPKPPAIKMKTINPLDVMLGARDMIGAVGYFEPKMPDPAGIPPEIWADLVKRFNQRDKEFTNYSAKMAEMTRMREYRVVDGVIYPFTPFPKLEPVARYGTLLGGDVKIELPMDQGTIMFDKQIFSEGPGGGPTRPVVSTPVIDPTLGPPVTGDHDMFDVRLADNQPLPYDKPEVPPGYPEPTVWFKKLVNEEAMEMAQIRGKGPETGEMLAWQMGVQHGAIRVFLLHEQVPDWERETIYDPIIAGHMPGGQPLVRFQAGRRPQLVNALTPVDQVRLPEGPPEPLLLGPVQVSASGSTAAPAQDSTIGQILNPPEDDQPADPNLIIQALIPPAPPATETSDD